MAVTATGNVLAAPDTLAVNAGSYFALGLTAATGVSLPLLASSGTAFAGRLAAAAVVLGLSGLGTGTVRLVLAGSALTLGLTAMTEGLLLLARRIDALALGDDAAPGLGVPVRATRKTAVVLAALLATAAVTLAGPVGFVGLCAPALVRPLARRGAARWPSPTTRGCPPLPWTTLPSNSGRPRPGCRSENL